MDGRESARWDRSDRSIGDGGRGGELGEVAECQEEFPPGEESGLDRSFYFWKEDFDLGGTNDEQFSL